MNRKKSLLVIVGALFVSGAVYATEYIWTGAGIGGANDQWQVPGNWSSNGVACTDENNYPHTSDDKAVFIGNARVLISLETVIGELEIADGVTFTHVRDQFLRVARLSGNGTLQLTNRGRFGFVNKEDITVTSPIAVNNNDDGQKMLIGAYNGYQVTYTGSLSGSGAVQFEGNLKLAGDNFAFAGTGTIHVNSTVEFVDPHAGSAQAVWRYEGANKKTSHINLDGDIFFGALQQVNYGSVDFRVNLGQIDKAANIIIGGIGEDSVIMGSWGDANNNNDRPNSYSKIIKVGDETLRVYSPWHRLGTEIRSGVLEVIGPNALTGRNTADISPIAFTGGTLRYGTDTTTDPANPTAVTTDWSSLVKGSTAAISVDTAGKDVVWASSSLSNRNLDTTGFIKKGEGTLELAGSNRDGTWSLFSDATKTVMVEAGVLAIRNAKFNSRYTLAARLLGQGTFKILSEEERGGIWLQGTEAFADFEGVLDWANELTLSKGENQGFYPGGFMMTDNVNFEMPKAKMRVSGNPEQRTVVMKGETQWNASAAHVTVGAYEHLHPNAVVRVERSAWTLNILGCAGDSVLNGTFEDCPVHVVKTGPGAITVGSGFAAPEGSTITVREGVFALEAGRTMDDMPAGLTIADGVRFTGAGTFSDVDLAKHDVVIPVTKETADKTVIYTLLTAESLTGELSETMCAQVAALNVGETKGFWRISTKSNPNGTVSLILRWNKFGLAIIVR